MIELLEYVRRNGALPGGIGRPFAAATVTRGLLPIECIGREFRRPLEDPDLVGEEAAARARSERLANKPVEDVLIREDRRWDHWLGMCRRLFNVL